MTIKTWELVYKFRFLKIGSYRDTSMKKSGILVLHEVKILQHISSWFKLTCSVKLWSSSGWDQGQNVCCKSLCPSCVWGWFFDRLGVWVCCPSVKGICNWLDFAPYSDTWQVPKLLHSAIHVTVQFCYLYMTSAHQRCSTEMCASSQIYDSLIP